MIVKLLTEHHLEFLSLKGCCTGSSESTLVKMPHCWKSHAMAHISTRWVAIQHHVIDTHYHNSNLIWRTVSRRVDEVIPSDHPRRVASRVIQWCGLIYET